MVYSTKELKKLEQQKQLLVANGEILRVLLVMRCHETRMQASQTVKPLHGLNRALRFLGPAAFSAGLLLARKGLGWRNAILKGALGWTLWRRAKPFWNLIRPWFFRS